LFDADPDAVRPFCDANRIGRSELIADHRRAICGSAAIPRDTTSTHRSRWFLGADGEPVAGTSRR